MKHRLTLNQREMLTRIAKRTKRGRGGILSQDLIDHAVRRHSFRTFWSLYSRGYVRVARYGSSFRTFYRLSKAGRDALVALFLVVFFVGCATVVIEPIAGACPGGCPTRKEIKTFGAVDVAITGDDVTTSSQGISDGLVGMVTGTVGAAKDAFLAFFNRGPTEPPTVIINPPAAPAQ